MIGIDGATLDLIEPFVQQGALPTIGRLMAEGVHGKLRSTIPPITAAAWTTFMTGKNPGKHRLYDFTGRRLDSYQIRPFTASHRAAESLWSILSRAGKRVCVINVPMTYPPEPVNGVLVSGMGTPATVDDFCHPERVHSELLQAIPNYEVQREDIFYPKGRELTMYQAVSDMTEMRRQAALHFLQGSEWDFFMVVFMATDLVQHFFWHFMDAEHPEYEANALPQLQSAILDCYRQIDKSIADILEQVDSDTQVVLMSDHGFGPQTRYLHFNTWLWKQGYLVFKRNLPTSIKQLLFRLGLTPLNVHDLLLALRMNRNVARAVRKNKSLVVEAINRVFLSFHDVDWTRTRAYSVGNIGPIYVNLKGREPQGAVSAGAEYEALLDELNGQLREMHDPASGQHIAGKVYRQHEIYHGEHAAEGPDLTFLPDDMTYIGYGELQFSTNRWISDSDRSGGHRMDGFVTMRGAGIKEGHRLEGAKLVDMAPTILAALDVNVPEDIDGQVLEDAFTPEFLSAMQVRYEAPQLGLQGASDGLSKEEEAELLKRLKGLGYVE